MAKDTFFFSHDYNTRSDIKIKKLIAKHGYRGYGLFWALIEELYNNKNELPLDYKTLSHDLRADQKILRAVINDFDLFVIENETFGSKSVEQRLNERNSKSVKARDSINKRWGKDTNVLPTNNDSNTIKESKVKDSKVKDSIVKESKETESPSARSPRIENPLILPFAAPEFAEVWAKLKRQKKWRIKSRDALEESLKLLGKQREQDAIQMMKNAIVGNYQGLFELDNKNNGKSNTVNSSGTRSTALSQPSKDFSARL